MESHIGEEKKKGAK